MIDIPSPSDLSRCKCASLGLPIPRFLRATLAVSSSSVISGLFGASIVLFGSCRPRHALITVLCLCRCISASIWFHRTSCSCLFKSRPSNCICWILINRNNFLLNIMEHYFWHVLCWKNYFVKGELRSKLKKKAIKMGVLDLLIVLRWSPLLASNKRWGWEPWCHTALRYFFYSPYTQYVLCKQLGLLQRR